MAWSRTAPSGVSFSYGPSSKYTANWWSGTYSIASARSGNMRYVAYRIVFGLGENGDSGYYPYPHYSVGFSESSRIDIGQPGQGTYYFYWSENNGAADSGSVKAWGWNDHIGDGLNDWPRKSYSIAAATYAVTYNANGGSGAPSSQTKTYGVTLTLSSTRPTRTGYTFLTWNTASDGTGTDYVPGASYTANAGTTLYAIWKKNNIPVFANDNGTIRQIEKAYVRINDEIKEATVYANVDGVIKVLT